MGKTTILIDTAKMAVSPAKLTVRLPKWQIYFILYLTRLGLVV